MPVFLERSKTGWLGASGDATLHIGLINNMPDGALVATERQFLKLLDRASGSLPVLVSLFAFPEVHRGEAGKRHISDGYSSSKELLNSHLDGLIVTGAEPRTLDLTGESYWSSLTRIIDWAGYNTHSAVWSCLAAHAAVLHTDGIHRRRLGEKRFGVFECSRNADHFLTAGLPSIVDMPHSRWNDLALDDLEACGYRALTVSDQSVDSFFREQNNSLFVFFQGHPEYEAETLLLEYRRDVGRYLRGERGTFPPLPQRYFGREAVATLTAFRIRALAERGEELFAEFPDRGLTGRGGANTWQTAAVQTYCSWLAFLNGAKQLRGMSRRDLAGLRQTSRGQMA